MEQESIDAYLELVPNQKNMKIQVKGESLDAQHRGGGPTVYIVINSFNFGNAQALEAKAKQQKLESRRDEEDEPPPPMLPNGGKRGENLDDNFRFQITKQLENASAHLLQGFLSNSNKQKRKEFNDFTEARVTFRKGGVQVGAPKPYLVFKFNKVRIVGYTLATQGNDPPTETVAFCFRACEIKYQKQAADGTLGVPVIRNWDFDTQKDKKN